MNQEILKNNEYTNDQLNGEDDRRISEVFRTMLLFTTLMVVAPISTYFFTKNYLYESMKIVYFSKFYF
jgi:hypothetical protein